MYIDIDSYNNQLKVCNKLIDETIKSILFHFEVRQNSNCITSHEEIKQVITKYNSQCKGITNNNNQCIRPVYKGDYCKTHYLKYRPVVYNRIVIEDEEFYTDEKFLYSYVDNEYIKCGLVKNGEYMFTSDPFILN